MYIDYTPEQKALRDELRSYFGTIMTPEERGTLRGAEGGETYRRIIRQMGKDGWLGVGFPKEYGGLGFSQVNYNRVLMAIASYCGSTAVLVSAHQSIGVPQPLLQFGTEDQKQRFLTRTARGEISAFALTEDAVGSDPARMETIAEPTPDGEHFIINGSKLWCTNGTRAGLLYGANTAGAVLGAVI